MAEVIVNHMASDSPPFRDFAAKASASSRHGLFSTMDSVFPQGATEQDMPAV